MKQHFVILAAAAAALLLLAGCDKQQLKGDDANGTVSVPVWFEPFGGASTKVDVDGTTGIGTWTVGDQIAIYVAGDGADFYQIKNVENIEAGNESTGHVMVSLAQGQNRANYAIYPANVRDDAHYGANDDLYVKYPAEYDYSNLTVAQMETFSPVPMVAVNAPVTNLDDPTQPAPALEFYHVGGVLRVTVPAVPQTAYALRFTFPADLKFSGTFKVTNGGTANATLTPQGSDHGNVITVKLPIIETASQDLVLNIPMPCGTYSAASRDYTVDVRTEKIAYMRTDGIINFSAVARAEGKKQTLPAVQTLGTIAEMYFTRGYLVRETATTTDPTKMSIYGSDQLAYYLFYGKEANTFGKRMYFQGGELVKIMTAGASTTGSYHDARLVIDGVSYRIPSREELERVLGGRPGAIVNGTSGRLFSKIKIDLTGSNYESRGTASGALIYPDGGVFNCSITNFNTVNASPTTITYGEFRKLTESPTGCLFFPYSGYTGGASWYGLEGSGFQYSSTFESSYYGLTPAPSITTNTNFNTTRLVRDDL